MKNDKNKMLYNNIKLAHSEFINEMLEKLKDLEQEAMDELTPEEYMAITSNVLDDYDRPVYQSGYIDGLQTAIRMLHEEETADTNEYSIEMDEVFGEMYDNLDENEY